MTRRTLVGSLAAAAALPSKSAPRHSHTEWRPKLGVLGKYTPANVAFAQEAGFTNMILDAGQHSTLDAATLTDTQIEEIRRTLTQHKMHVSAFQLTTNHIDPDPDRRTSTNTYFVRAIELAGKLGVPYIGTASGKNPHQSFTQQVDEVVRTYSEHYFPACERN
ncbi:MAG: TIM barrel protein, partial [Acidobacteriaceae bacterium]|nr:TIM barrel protein [Acidobacteriaceae bacterium]